MKYLLILLLFVSPAAYAQDKNGVDTAGEWVVNHFETYGLWDTVCDARTISDQREERCYIRYVDVFSPAPKFAAQFAFVTLKDAQYHVEFGIERRTRYEPDGFRIVSGDATTWVHNDRCLRGPKCEFEGDDAKDLLVRMSGLTQKYYAFEFEFTDRHGTPRKLIWGLSDFRAALDDFDARIAERGFPHRAPIAAMR